MEALLIIIAVYAGIIGVALLVSGIVGFRELAGHGSKNEFLLVCGDLYFIGGVICTARDVMRNWGKMPECRASIFHGAISIMVCVICSTGLAFL
tara:strand:- start:962 stop:1243 length:282 start_codon:yes stop_codon:yes gene_type:complete